jgi:hypothetical protein
MKANLFAQKISGFNDPAVQAHILTGEGSIFRAPFPVNADVDLKKVFRGTWLTLNTDGELVFVTGTAGNALAFMSLDIGEQSDIQAFPDTQLTLTVAHGIYMAQLGTRVYETGKDYAVGTELKATGTGGSVEPGLLTPASGSDKVVARSLGIDANSMLWITTLLTK